MTVEQSYFSGARASCLNEGGELVKISSEEENNFVKDMANSEEPWIGLQKADDGNFSWTDGSGLSFSKLKGLTEPSDPCVKMDSNRDWVTTGCYVSHWPHRKSTCEQSKLKKN